jgi:hypothetical protein
MAKKRKNEAQKQLQMKKEVLSDTLTENETEEEPKKSQQSILNFAVLSPKSPPQSSQSNQQFSQEIESGTEDDNLNTNNYENKFLFQGPEDLYYKILHELNEEFEGCLDMNATNWKRNKDIGWIITTNKKAAEYLKANYSAYIGPRKIQETNKRAYIHNLPKDIPIESIEKLKNKINKIILNTEIEIPTQRGYSLGWGFVNFDSQKDRDKAIIQIRNTKPKILEWQIKINVYKPKQPKEQAIDLTNAQEESSTDDSNQEQMEPILSNEEILLMFQEIVE